jgi:hypothetical protein
VLAAHRLPLVATASLDGFVKISSLSSRVVVATFDATAPVWSCCWHPLDNTLLLAGLQTGTVVLLDTAKCGEGPLKCWNLGSSSPVHSIAATSLRNDDRIAVLAASVSDVRVIDWNTRESESPTEATSLPQDTVSLFSMLALPSPVGPVCNVSVDSELFVVSFRANANGSDGQHVFVQATESSEAMTWIALPGKAAGHRSNLILSRTGLCGEYCASGDESGNTICVWKRAEDAWELVHKLGTHGSAVLDVKLWRVGNDDAPVRMCAAVSSTSVLLFRFE